MSHRLALTVLLLFTSLSAHAITLTRDEQRIFDLMRAESGQKRPFLKVDATLTKVARSRADDMARRGYFDHVNPDGNGPNYLVRQAGYSLPDWWGNDRQANYVESISAGYSSPDAAWKAWMGSSGHRTHLLATDSFYADQTSVGIGVITRSGSKYGTYYVVITAPPDKEPALSVAEPDNAEQVTGPSVQLSGSCGHPGIELVEYRVENRDGNTPYVTADGVRTWSGVARNLVPGRNTVRIVARGGGNVIAEVARFVDYIVPADLHVTVTPGGTITRGFRGVTSRNVGFTYGITATPTTGYLFAGWTGSIESGSRSLSFRMEPGFALTATFVPNIYPGIRGMYNASFDGLVGAGLMKLSLQPDGKFSGLLMIGASSIPLQGRLGGSQTWQTTVTDGLGRSLVVRIDVRTGDGTTVVAANISDGVVSDEIILGRAAYGRKHPAPLAGRYTVVLPAVEGSTDGSPEGDGIATLVVKADGSARVNGFLPDGTAFQVSSHVTNAGQLPIYASLYGGAGVMVGTVTFRVTEVSDLDGAIAWRKSGVLPVGFTASRPMIGARYREPRRAPTPLRFPAGSDEAILTAGEGGLATPIEESVHFGSSTTRSTTPASAPAVLFTNESGMMSGSFIDPESNTARTFQGIVLQKQNAAFGYFLGATESGYVTLVPAVP
jgi:hypothetical protein